MKKAYILLSVLAVLCALTLVSCSVLSSSKPKTGNFTYTIDENLINAIARANAPGNQGGLTPVAKPLYTLNISIKSKVPGAYDNYQSKEDILSVLKETTFEFNDIPLNTPLVLTDSVFSDGKLLYLSDTVEFTLTSDAVKELEAVLNKVLSTPIVLCSSSYCYYRYTASPESLPKYDGKLKTDASFIVENRIVNAPYFCQDNEGNLYTAKGYELTSTNMTGISYHCELHFEDFDEDGDTSINGLCYDPIRNKVVVIIKDITEPDGEDFNIYFYQFTPGTLPETLTLSPTTPGVIKPAKGVFFDTFAYDTVACYAPTCAYAYNGRLYSLLTMDSSYVDDEDQTHPSVTLRVQSLSDGSWIKDSTITIPVVKEVETSWYSFNDMYVDESGIYILFNQYEMWHEAPEYPYNDDTLTEMNAGDNGFIDRGGIIVADYETLAQKKAFGMPAINTSLTVPLITDVSAEGQYYYPKLFADAAHTKEKTVTIPVTYSVANEGKGELANPQKIVGILPKKLIIADGGTFLYTNELDFTVETGDKAGVYALNNKDKITSDTATRLVEIDLETFSAKVVASIDDYNFYESTLNSGFRVEYKQQIPQGNTSYYGYEMEFAENFYDTTSGVKYLDNTSCQYNNGSYHAIANIVFGEAGV